MKKRAMVVDVAKCINCNNCVLSTKDEHIGNDFPGYAAAQPEHGHEWISIERRTRGSGAQVQMSYVPKMCNHCDAAPCITAAGDGAIHKRPDGIVIIDPEKARGRRDLVSSCPYGQISWNETSQLPQMWIFDAHLLDAGWTQPRCVQVCPTGALESVHETDEALRERVAREDLEVLQPQLGTQPRVYYRNLRQTSLRFANGNVYRSRAQGGVENVEGAQIALSIDEQAAATVRTDAFGDFKIDGLQTRASRYQLKIAHPEHGTAEFTGPVPDSGDLGSFELNGCCT
jgi:Fe-S-cluster-containing dehydrogenase component